MNDSETNPPAKRPASHKWALFVYVAVAGINIMLNFMGHFDILGVIVTMAAVSPFLAPLLWARSTRTYTLGVIALGTAFIRSVQSLWFDIAGCWRETPLHAPEHLTLPATIFAGCCCVLLFLLFRIYMFGAPSRRYFGLPVTPITRSAFRARS